MRKTLVAVVAALACAAAWGQEVVVFKSYRAMPIVSHRVQGKWTYLKVAEGEVAVPTVTIREYRKEPAAPPAPVGASPAGGSKPYRPAPPPAARPEPPPEPEYQEPPPEEPPPEEPPPGKQEPGRADAPKKPAD